MFNISQLTHVQWIFKLPATLFSGWYQDENGDWYNQFDWYQDENGEYYYDDQVSAVSLEGNLAKASSQNKMLESGIFA